MLVEFNLPSEEELQQMQDEELEEVEAQLITPTGQLIIKTLELLYAANQSKKKIANDDFYNGVVCQHSDPFGQYKTWIRNTRAGAEKSTSP